jgi:hypothetical protein
MARQSIRLSYPDVRPVANIGFKPLKEGFFLEKKRFVAHKSFNVTNDNTGSFGIYVLKAQLGDTGSLAASTSPVQLPTPRPSGIIPVSSRYQNTPTQISRDGLWRSLNTMFFNTTISSSLSRQVILENTASVVSIPMYRVWGGIKPTSLQITNSSAHYNDIYVAPDLGIIVSQSNVAGIIQSGSTLAKEASGYVFYKHGLIVMNNTGSSQNVFLGNGSWNYSSNPFNFTYKSTREFDEYSILCEIGKGEFNVTTNPTSLSGSSNVRAGFAVSSSFDPYFTKIGLYNDDSELMAVAKLSTPLRKSSTNTFIVNIKFDID